MCDAVLWSDRALLANIIKKFYYSRTVKSTRQNARDQFNLQQRQQSLRPPGLHSDKYSGATGLSLRTLSRNFTTVAELLNLQDKTPKRQ